MSRKDFIAGYMAAIKEPQRRLSNGRFASTAMSPAEFIHWHDDGIYKAVERFGGYMDDEKYGEVADLVMEALRSDGYLDGTGYVASKKVAYNFMNRLNLTDEHAELAVRAYEIFLDDADWQIEDLDDEYECALAVSEAVIEAKDELGIELDIAQEREIIEVVHNRLRADGICASRKSAGNEPVPVGEWVSIGDSGDYARYDLLGIPTHGADCIKLYGDGTVGGVSTAPWLGDDGAAFYWIYEIETDRKLAGKTIEPCPVGFMSEIKRLCDEAHGSL